MARPATPMFPPPLPPVQSHDVCADGALSVKDAAKFTGISRSEIYLAVHRGELEMLYHGRKPLIPKRLLVAWLAKKLDTERRKRFTNL